MESLCGDVDTRHLWMGLQAVTSHNGQSQVKISDVTLLNTELNKFYGRFVVEGDTSGDFHCCPVPLPQENSSPVSIPR